MGFNPIRSLESAAHTVADAATDGAKAFEGALKNAGEAVTHMSPSDLGHTALDIASFVPGLGTVTGLANAGWYAAEGDWGNAALSAATAIPIAGDFVDALKVGKDAVTIGGDVEKGLKLGEEAANAAKAEKAAANTAKDGEKVAQASADAGKAEKAPGSAGEPGAKPPETAPAAGSSEITALPKGEGELKGVPEVPPKNANAEMVRSIDRQNEAAKTLSEHGLEVEQLPNTGRPGPNPDLKINGETADVYSPKTQNMNTIRSTIESKATTQADHVVVNLDDSPVSSQQLISSLKGDPVPGAKDVYVIKGSTVTKVSY
jgi:filamentous hemagglutinin